MKLLSTLLLSCFLFSSLIGQFGLDPEVILIESLGGEDVEVKVDFTNNTGEFVNIYWMCETDENYPKEWGTIICDKATCYGEDTFKSNPNLPNEMEAGSSFVFKFSINANGAAGKSYLILHAYDDEDCENEVATSNPPPLSTLSEKEIANLLVYPNPTQDYFGIRNDENVKSIDIINSSGKLLLSTSHQKDEKHSITNLSSGVFVAVLKDSENNILKSLYLYKD